MSFISLIVVALALGIDAFAVAMAAGMTNGKLLIRPVFRMSFHFGLFQAIMPVIGWFAGVAIYSIISSFDHWIAFGLLVCIGIKMIVESFKNQSDDKKTKDPTRGWSLVWLSVATSIDALAVGLSLAVLGQDIVMPAIMIGLVAALMTIAGMTAGRVLGGVMGKRVEAFGGIVLVSIGIKILVEHMT